jgi:hypothetical protein
MFWPMRCSRQKRPFWKFSWFRSGPATPWNPGAHLNVPGRKAALWGRLPLSLCDLLPEFARNEKKLQGLRQNGEDLMRKLTIALLAGAGALFVGRMLQTSIPAANTPTRICCSQFGWSVMTAVDAIVVAAAA